MTWRHFNAGMAICCAVLTVASVALWVVAFQYDFIGDTRFIGHVSMVALVLGALSSLTGSVAGWRADVPTDGD